MGRGHVRTGAAALLAVVSLLLTLGAASAEEPLGELVAYPPGQVESRRAPVGNEAFYIDQAGVRPGEILEEVSIVTSADITSGRTVPIVRGTRFVTEQAAEAAALALASRDVGPVRDLGSLGDGFIVTVAGEGSSDGRYAHDGFRVRGRDLFSFAAVTFDGDPAIPTVLLDHMRWHVGAFPGGSERNLPASGPSLASRGVPAAAVVLLAAVVWVAVRRRRRRPPPAPRPPHRTDPGAGVGGPAAQGEAGSWGHARVVW